MCQGAAERTGCVQARAVLRKCDILSIMARQGMFERSNAGLSITKWGLIIFNVAFWVSTSRRSLEVVGCVGCGILQWSKPLNMLSSSHLPPPSSPPPSTHTHMLQSIGVVSLAIGLWLYIANNEYATFSAGAHLYGSVFLIGVGFGITIVGFLGIVAAIWESVIISTAVSLTSSTRSGR